MQASQERKAYANAFREGQWLPLSAYLCEVALVSPEVFDKLRNPEMQQKYIEQAE